ncbi:MAG TPA: aconitate hydratase AcnA [Pseudomonadales bacterium]|nr:aconitate hydratase AcnA [Pseudomonadales bacterium]
MAQRPQDTLRTRRTLEANGKPFDYYSLPAAQEAGIGDLTRLPISLKVLLENLLRFEDGTTVSVDDIRVLGNWVQESPEREIAYRPARVLMQDFTGVPGVADLAAMREAVAAAGKDPSVINPLSPVDLVIDHSVMVDRFGTPQSFGQNVEIEMQRNAERYRFLRWGQKAFDNFRVVPPGTGICHQVNLEYLAKGVWTKTEDGATVAYPDTLVGTDSHTTMINGLGVLGWGVGGIEAEAAMLGQPVSMLIPEVVGFELTGELMEGITATDLVLTVVEMLRKKGVVGKFVEFYGNGLDHLSLADRATIANMAPEYGATCGFFPIDAEAVRYLQLSGRDADTCALVEAYCKAQGMWRDADTPAPQFADTLHLDMVSVEPSLAGPKRPQDRVAMAGLHKAFDEALELSGKGADAGKEVPVAGANYSLAHGDVVIAAITSCTNTSNPAVMLGAGLVAKKARALGLTTQPWVKTSLAPGSKVVTEYLTKSALQDDLNAMGFDLVGYGCTTCIGNSGPLAEEIEAAITEGDLVVSSVLSGNRNFEGRVHQLVRANWLASPPLVVAYAIAGTTRIDLTKDPIGKGADGKDVFLKDIWPSSAEVRDAVAQVDAEMFRTQYADVFSGDATWQAISVSDSKTYEWPESTYIKSPPFFELDGAEKTEVLSGARVLALLGDSVTTDHISPAGEIPADGPAGLYLQEHKVAPEDFNSFGSRRGNHEVMMRGTFANTRIRNEMVPGVEGGYTTYVPSGEQMPIYDAAMKYQAAGTPLVVIAGKEYGTGSSRDWAAKGTLLLGVKAVITESFERIHRSNLIGMGILPLQFEEGTTRTTLGLDGSETVDVLPAEGGLKPGARLTVRITRADGSTVDAAVICRLDTDNELAYFRAGGILTYVLKDLVSRAA